MSVDPRTSLRIVRKELKDCEGDSKRFGWKISEIDEANQSFTVEMKSPVDNEVYIIEIKFDNYKEWPLLIEFVDPSTGEKGTRRAYPVSRNDGFFNNRPCICHPCCRKAYREYTGLHSDWNMVGWQDNPQVGALTNIRAILLAIYSRISKPNIYGGRMSG